MNRYQQEVARSDRRRALIVRTLSFAGAGCLAVAALWSAGLPPDEWWTAAHRWWAQRQAPEQIVSPGPAPAAVPSGIPVLSREASAESVAGTASSVSATPLPLYLVATTPGRNKNEGTARIGTSIENPQTYVAGAILANGTRLAEIHRDHVVLERGRLSARLDLYRRDPRAERPAEVSALLTVGGEPEAASSAAKTVYDLTRYLRPTPIYDGEVLRGFQVYPGARSGVFARIGLEPGDIVTAIDDMPLSDPAQALELFGQLMYGAAVIATVERKNAARRITLDGAVIAADQESTSRAVEPSI